MAHPIPEGFHTITPHLIIKGGAQAIAFYQRAFGAEVLSQLEFPGAEGEMKVGHADLRIEIRTCSWPMKCRNMAIGPAGSSPVTIHLYVSDVDAAFERAVAAGMPRR